MHLSCIGPNSSEFYKIYNNEQLSSAQLSGFGAFVGNVPVAAIGQADDTALVSHDISSLQLLLNLSLSYCERYQVKLSTNKTKLLCYTPNETDYTKYAKILSPININMERIPFVETAEHVGVIRATQGNLPHIHKKIVSHRKSLGAILSAGLARRHRANPLASIRAERIFATPVLFSGMAALILKKSETDILTSHVKQTLEGLLKLHKKTPAPFIYLISGTMPAEATLHIKQLTLFGMICRLPDNILNKIARETLLTCKDSDKSWFALIRTHCYTYGLPHPLSLLSRPPPKEEYKKLVKINVAQFWQNKLRVAVKDLKSLKFFKPEFMSVLHPHPMLTTAGTSYEINKMVVQLRMLSGRYRIGTLLRHFSDEISGVCELCGSESEDIIHLLVPRCKALKDKRASLLEYSTSVLKDSPEAMILFNTHINSDETTMVQFLLDCSVIPAVIAAAQQDDEILKSLFKVTRSWCYTMHRARLQLLQRWH